MTLLFIGKHITFLSIFVYIYIVIWQTLLSKMTYKVEQESNNI